MFGFINNFYLLIVLFIVARIVKTITTFFPNAIRVFEDFCTLPLNVSIDIGQLRLPIALTRWYLKHPSSSYHTNAGEVLLLFVAFLLGILLGYFLWDFFQLIRHDHPTPIVLLSGTIWYSACYIAFFDRRFSAFRLGFV